MNNFKGIGNLTGDPEVRYTQKGTESLAIAKFTLAVKIPRKKDETSFIRCTAFGKLAETIEKYVRKGNKVAVDGYIQTGSYEKDGHKVYTTDVIVTDIEFLTPKSDTAAETSNDFMKIPDGIESELPFN